MGVHRTIVIGWVLALTVLGAWRQEASAQIRGVVTADGGVLLVAVAVELWSADQRIAARLTDSEGRFFFPESVAFRAVTIRAGALGFEATRIEVRDGVTNYDIRLSESPLILEGLVVTTEEATCEQGRDDKRARALWEYARRRYQGVMDTLGIATYLAQADTVVPISQLGPLRLPTLNLSQRESSSLLRFSWTRRIKREGYAFKVRRTDGARAYDSWVYPPLEADFAPHFVDELFGERHRMIVKDEGQDGWSLGYCPKKDKKPSIKGTIVLAPDTSFTSVEWSFQTPEPLEHAGGRAFFAPLIAQDGAPYFLPTEAIIWREVPTGDYFQRYQRYEGWLVAPGDSVPRLPLRGGTEFELSRER